MPQFLINSKDVTDNRIVISDKDNYTHIAKSLRTKVGEKLLLIDENQIQYETFVDSITNSDITVKVDKKYKSERYLNFKLYLAQVPLRSDAQSFVIEKATELGVDGVYPIMSDNCTLNSDVIEKKIPKWQKIMYEAFKQCERSYIPQCYELSRLEDIIKKNGEYRVIAFCERCTDLSLHTYFEKSPIKAGDNIIVIIGPEGGFSPREIEAIKAFKNGKVHLLNLGNTRLRARTAAIIALGKVL